MEIYQGRVKRFAAGFETKIGSVTARLITSAVAFFISAGLFTLAIRIPVASGTEATDGTGPIVIEQLSHAANFSVGTNLYSTTTTFILNKQTLSVHAPTGTFVDLGHTPTSLIMTAGDKDAKKRFDLILMDIGQHQLDAVLQIDGICFTATGPATRQIFDMLKDQINDPNLIELLPRGTGLMPLANAMQNKPKLVDFAVGTQSPFFGG